jgi:hypothetical protein
MPPRLLNEEFESVVVAVLPMIFVGLDYTRNQFPEWSANMR